MPNIDLAQIAFSRLIYQIKQAYQSQGQAMIGANPMQGDSVHRKNLIGYSAKHKTPKPQSPSHLLHPRHPVTHQPNLMSSEDLIKCSDPHNNNRNNPRCTKS